MSQIIIQRLTFTTSDGNAIFSDLSLAFSNEKTAIVGKNGIGKSTLLKLITGMLQPTSCSIKVTGLLGFCPQNFTPYFKQTIAEIFEVKDKLIALENISNGSTKIEDFETLDEDWSVSENITTQLNRFGFNNLSLDRQLQDLSGGEITRVWLAKLFYDKPDMILLDEPTNNLDAQGKQWLYQAISEWNKGLIIISHDRQLLELMDQILELSPLGAKIYGGNYTAYVAQHEIEQKAKIRQLQDAKKALHKTKQAIQQTQEKLAQRARKGKSARKTGSQSKLILDSMEERSGKTQGKLSIREKRLLDAATEDLSTAKENIAIENQIKIELPKTNVPTHKLIVDMESVSFAYQKNAPLIIKNLNFSMYGPERIAIKGNNGSGKTTLIKLIQGVLQPTSGKIKVGTTRICYADQQVQLLDHHLTILDNYLKLNPDINERDARFNLADFLFRNQEALKMVDCLSGGEKLRALLASVLTSNTPPQLLILDEPTNHLDLESTTALESALQHYQGALLVISHDNIFLQNIGIQKTLQL